MKRHELQCGIVQRLTRFWIAGKKNLKSAIELKSFDAISASTPPDAVRRFKNRAREARVRQTTRTSQSGKPGADNKYIGS